jgi:hypothetical protein
VLSKRRFGHPAISWTPSGEIGNFEEMVWLIVTGLLALAEGLVVVLLHDL